MFSVQSLHNASDSNSKPSFVMGHHFEAIALMCKVGDIGAVAVPLAACIAGGITVSNRCTKTLLDKFVTLFHDSVAPSFDAPKLLVVDAYYITAKVVAGLLQSSAQLISRVKPNCVAFWQPRKANKGRRGRSKK